MVRPDYPSRVRSLRFLASRRWVLFALVVVALAYLAWVLGQWQFGRLDDRRAHNAIVARNEGAEPAPVGSVLAPGRPVAEADEWRLVTASGTYDAGRHRHRPLPDPRRRSPAWTWWCRW